MPRGMLFLTLALCLVPVGLLIARQQTPPTFRGSAVLVTVDAYPQQNGQIVEGLKPEDFDVFEDGKPQKVENFDFVRVEPALTEAARLDPNTIGEARALAADPRNRLFIVYLDTYHVDVAGSHAARQPLVDTLNRVLTPSDLFGVMTPKMRPSDLTLARKLQSIEDQLTRYWPWGERFSIVREPEEEFIDQCFKGTQVQDGAVVRDLADVVVMRRREDQTLTSLEDLVRYLATLREARSAVLLFTDGWLLYEPERSLESHARPGTPGVYGGPGRTPSLIPPAMGSASSSDARCSAELLRVANLEDGTRLRDLITEANRHNVTFYPINPSGLAVFDEPLSVRSAPNPSASPGLTPFAQDHARQTSRVQNLRTLAENTDGLAVVDTNDLATGLRKVVNDVSAYYLLGYYSTNTKLDGNYHRIQVKMKRPGLTVKARRGYFAPSEAAVAATKPTPASIAAAAAAAPVADALNALARLRPSAELFVYGARRAADLALVAEIPSARIESGQWAQGGDVEADVTGPSGESLGTAKGRIEPTARGAVLAVPLPAGAAGPWRVNVKVSAGTERLEEGATIESAAAGPLLGEPIAYRAAPGPRSPIRPVADFQFRRTERVHVEWPVKKPLDQRQARLLGKNGLPLAVAVTLTETPNTPALAADVNLAPLGPGDYVIEVTAGSGAAAETKFLAIRVVQ
jgi:VWFA-related protein